MTTFRTTQPTHPLTPWTASAYAPANSFSGANKLASSGVAPLVALARGYETLEQPQVAEFAKHNSLGAANSKQHAQVLAATRRGDVMVVRWYRADQVATAHTAGLTPVASSLQLRPGIPRESPTTGKLLKYENLVGSQSVIDTNPATPAEWFTSSPKILITEGVLKGDSALTALLRANGVTDEQLSVKGRVSRGEAINRLHSIMLGIPQSKQVTILSFVGVGNWKGNDVWVSLKLSGRQLLLAFDGDIDSNWNVWSQANNLWGFAAGRKAHVKLVDLSVDADGEMVELLADTGSAKPEKVGIDDFLVRHGSWDDLLTRIKDELPDAPARSRYDVPVGTWQVSEDGTSVQEYVAGPPDASGHPGPAHWKVQVNIGGRVVAVETHRAPTEEEVETAHFDENINPADFATADTCRIELKWIQDDGTVASGEVTGPATLLMYPPSEWDKRHASIPKSLLLHPEWPPRRGSDWLSAIKANNETPAEQNVAWSTMGWVPVENSAVCSFISGRTVIAPTEASRLRTIAGVNEVVLPGSSKFSLPEIEGEVMGEAWKAQVREDLSSLYEHYISLAPWTNIDIAAVVMAAGLRPAVPLRCTTNLYVQGPPGQGKSWTVAQILAFHQARKTWSNKMLPGSMKDTGTSIEQAIAQTNIWVMDDLAPSPDRRQNDLEQSKIGDIIRSVHNGSSKRRSGTELKAREVFTPRALMITTAENEHTINSVRDRSVILSLGRGSLRDGEIEFGGQPARTPVEIMDEFRDNNRAPGRLMRAAVQAMQYAAVINGWEVLLEQIATIKKDLEVIARAVISQVKVDGKSDSRHVEMAVDLMLGLAPLNILAEMVEDDRFLAMFEPETADNLPERIARVLSVSFQSQGESTPGRAILAAISDLLSAGRGHILNANDPTAAPLTGDHAGSNRALGWQADSQGNFRPLGTAIGVLTAAGKNSPMDLIMLDPTVAFDLAQRYSSRTLPPGSSAKMVWLALWSEALVHPIFFKRKLDKDGRPTKIFVVDGRKRTGIPVHLDSIIGAESLPGVDLKA
ncbi:hypothetical protein [Frigoribacterium sp. UYMn621]|uniref:hypothetical protein n=1 Tax=Frigoribacterium sp. UYMn621 TaxID=3156343 RepID=UPI0033958DCC